MHHLYVMLSRTDTGMGRLIRGFTGFEYNHVSLSIDNNLQQFVSFARYWRDVPLAGGYVSESALRLRACGKTMPVRIFRLDISADEAKRLEALFELAGHAPLIYNSVGAILTSLRIRCPVPGAYTCLEFADAVLGTSFSSINALAEALEPWEIFNGNLFDILKQSAEQDATFFQRQGFRKGTYSTAVHFKTLLWRILRLERPQDPIAACKLNLIPKEIPQSSL